MSVALVAGCAVGPNYRTPDTLPGSALKLREADVASVSPSPLPPRWWGLFDDADLDRLVEKALAHNTDLRQAAANLQRARAAQALRVHTLAAILRAGFACRQPARARLGQGGASPL